ncbi:MAG: hypothetical protein ACJA0Q_001783 [Saprospiraceae bacterium]|jgi:hypothetical protein
MIVKRIFIICMLLSTAAYGQWGWRMDFYSVKGGANWSEQYKFVPTLGVEYLSGYNSCIAHKFFRAIGTNIELHPEVLDIQLQVKANPFRHYGTVPIKLRTTLHGYFLLGTHYRKQLGAGSTVLLKPGVGFVLWDRTIRQISLLPEVNVGYVFNDNITGKQPYLFVELRFGLSYRDKRSKKENDEVLTDE